MEESLKIAEALGIFRVLTKGSTLPITLDGTIPNDEILGMIDDSYDLVVKGLKESDRQELQRTK